MNSTLRATTFKNSQKSFLDALEAEGIKYNRRIQLSEAPMLAGITVDIIISMADGWGALAVACIAWAGVRRSRRINVTTKDKQSILLEGYSADEAAKILESAKEIAVIDSKPENDEA